MNSSHPRARLKATPTFPACQIWINKLASCCHPHQDLAELEYHPEPGGQALADLGPATRSSLNLHAVEANDNAVIERLVSTTVRKSISYPDFQADAIAVSDGDSLRSSPGRGRNSLRRLHSNLIKRLSRASSAANSASPARPKHGHHMNMSQESINRRKELKRALHKRLTNELLEERGAMSRKAPSESELPLVDSIEKTDDDRTIKPPASLRSRKSSRSMATGNGLPTVAEIDDMKAKLDPTRLAEDDKKSTGRSSWVTDLPSSGWVTRKPSGSAMNGEAPKLPPSEPVPELPEVFAKLKRGCEAAQNVSPPDRLEDSADKRHDLAHMKRLSSHTHEAIRDVFKPLERSPRRLGLWLRRSVSSFDSRQSSLRKSLQPARKGGNPSSSDKSAHYHSSTETSNARTPDDVPSLDGAVDVLHLENVRPRTDMTTELKQLGNGQSSSEKSPLAVVRTMVRNVLEAPFVPSGRVDNKEKGTVQTASSTFLKGTDLQLQETHEQLCTKDQSTKTSSPLIVSSKSLSDENESSLEDHCRPPTPVRKQDESFVEVTLTVDKEIASKDSDVSKDKRARHQRSSSLESSTASFRAREIAAVSKRIISVKKHRQERRNSKFKEAFDEEDKPASAEPAQGSLWQDWALSLDGPADAPGELVPPAIGLQRTRSYTMADFMQSQETAGRVWERALQEHAFDIAHRSNETRRTSLKSARAPSSRARRPSFRNTKGKEPVRDDVSTRRAALPYDDDISPGASPKRSPESSPSRSHLAPPQSPLRDFSFSSSLVSEEVSSIQPGQILGKADTPACWARFPSHTRDERNGPAGATDLVSTHDFGGPDGDEPQSPHEQRHFNTRNVDSFHPSQLGRAPTTAMTHLPTAILRFVSRFSDQASLELAVRRSAHRGIRSSISAGSDEVTAPELKLLGLSTPAYHPSAMFAPEDPDLDRAAPQSPMTGRAGGTDEIGLQLTLPVDWNFGRRRSSAYRCPSRSEIEVEEGPMAGPSEDDVEAVPRNRSPPLLLVPPEVLDGGTGLQKPRPARLTSTTLSNRHSDEKWARARRRSHSHSGIQSDHMMEMKPLRTVDRSGVASDPRSMSSGYTWQEDVEEIERSLLRKAIKRD